MGALCWGDAGVADAQAAARGWARAGGLAQCQLFLLSPALGQRGVTRTLHSCLHPPQEQVEEGACPALQQWKESVACGVCVSSVPVSYNQHCHLQS